MTHSAFSSRTRLLQAGRPESGWVNTPVSRASTYVFESVAQWREVRERRNTERLPSYGARGTDSTFALEDALIELEGGYRAKAYCTGQAAITIVLLAYLRAGDHVLITDAVYEPVRRFAKTNSAVWASNTVISKRTDLMWLSRFVPTPG